MPSGGARARSGPAPDPNALRRDRADDKSWTTLPAGGFAGSVPEWPLRVSADLEAAVFEAVLWDRVWRKPQAIMWAKLGLEFQVAAYVRAFSAAASPSASAGLKTAVLRMEGELGISSSGMASLRWRFSEDEVAAKRSTAVRRPPAVSSVKARLARNA